MDDVTAELTEPDDLDVILGEDASAEPAVQIPMESIIIGEEYEGVVNNVVSYGAFVDIGTEVRDRRISQTRICWGVVSLTQGSHLCLAWRASAHEFQSCVSRLHRVSGVSCGGTRQYILMR